MQQRRKFGERAAMLLAEKLYFRRKNRKERYRSEDGRFPFVRLAEWPGLPYLERKAFLQQVLTNISTRTPATTTVPQCSEFRKPRLSINDFRSRVAYGGDGNRIDLAYAVYAFAHGATEQEVRAMIASRDLSKKGPEKRQREYVERTIRKACSTLGR